MVGFEPFVAFDAKIMLEKSKSAISIVENGNLVTTRFARGTAGFSVVSLQIHASYKAAGCKQECSLLRQSVLLALRCKHSLLGKS